MTSNIILATDSYKASHWLQFLSGTQNVHCYIESRGGSYDRTVFVGLQAFLRQYLGNPITQADIEEAAEFFTAMASRSTARAGSTSLPFMADGCRWRSRRRRRGWRSTPTTSCSPS